MLDIKFVEQNKNLVMESLEKRSFPVGSVREALELNDKRKTLVQEVESQKSELNSISKSIGKLIKENPGEAQILKEKVTNLKVEMKKGEETLKIVEEQIVTLLMGVPNILHQDVPRGKTEDDNKEIFQSGSPRSFDFEVKEHWDLGEKLGLLDFEAAAKISGSRFSVLKGHLARLERALANFMLDTHLDHGYEEVIPPFIVHERSLMGTGQLPKFAEDVFKLEDKPWYLIPTAEVPLTNLKREELFPEEELPYQYAGYTPCFRSEAGSYGKDTKGLIRLHQFNKVELVHIVKESESEKFHEKMIQDSRRILDLLKLPYRGMLLCSADIGFSAHKCVDIEVWLPGQNKYREISSISNCWDFQARRAGIRYRDNESKKPKFAHTLNGSGLAVGRTLVAVLENYQNKDGSIQVPKVLIPYMGGLEVIS